MQYLKIHYKKIFIIKFYKNIKYKNYLLINRTNDKIRMMKIQSKMNVFKKPAEY